MNLTSESTEPKGELTLRVVALEKDTNAHGDIFAGWLVSQMDLATSSLASRIAEGRTATVSISNLDFISPIRVGAEVSCYASVVDIGHTSIKIETEVWTRTLTNEQQWKAAEGEWVFVAIDASGRIRKIPKED